MAIPAAADTGLALNVPGWAIFSVPWALATSKSSQSRMSLRPATAPPGMPPATIFASVVISGVIPSAACTPPGDTRKPVTTSSKISTVPACLVRSRRTCKNDGSDRHPAEIRPRGFQYNRGDIAVVVEQPGDPRDIVRVAQQHVAGHAVEHAAGRRAIKMIEVAAGHVVVPAMEVAAEPDQLRPASVCAREAQRHQGRLGAGRGEPHPFGRRDHLRNQFSPAHLEVVTGAEVRTPVQRRAQGRHHCRMVVAQYQRTVAAEVIDVFVAIHVPLQRAQRALHIDRIWIEMPAIMGQAAWHQPARLCREPAEPGVIAS